MIEIRDQFRKIAALLTARAAVAGGTGHGGTTGRLREEVVHTFLRPHIPKTIDIRSGIVIDSFCNRSTQQDCVLVDTQLPVIDVGSPTEAVLLAESVIATIEVKSFLDKDELLECLTKCAVLKKLQRVGQQMYQKGGGVQMYFNKPLPIFHYIFAFDGLTLGALEGHIMEYQKTQTAKPSLPLGDMPEAICVLNRGVLQRESHVPRVQRQQATQQQQVTLPDLKNSKYKPWILRQDALLVFYKRLLDDVMQRRMSIFDLDPYYSGQDLA